MKRNRLSPILFILLRSVSSVSVLSYPQSSHTFHVPEGGFFRFFFSGS